MPNICSHWDCRYRVNRPMEVTNATPEILRSQAKVRFSSGNHALDRFDERHSPATITVWQASCSNSFGELAVNSAGVCCTSSIPILPHCACDPYLLIKPTSARHADPLC